jgi:hypothetical protein
MRPGSQAVVGNHLSINLTSVWRLSGVNPAIFARWFTDLHQRFDTTPACFYGVDDSNTSVIVLGEANEITT